MFAISWSACGGCNIIKVIKNIKNVTGCRDTRTARSKETREGCIWSNITVMYTTPPPPPPPPPPTEIFFYTRCIMKKICRGTVYITVMFHHMHPSLVSLLFAVLVSLHPVTFLMLLVHVNFFSSRCILKFAVTEQKSQ